MAVLTIGEPQITALTLEEQENISLSVEKGKDVALNSTPTTVVMENDYNELTNLPSIEGVTLKGDKSFSELNLMNITNEELENMLTI